ncbi:hypothetical protein HYALB_00004765 [Hymenoscyphus albidus]|uniref:Uncharacterized protein n=1 Tax=Hymenoscyphus albidus TaxID=595503 RepID=A0A9N9Q6E5_9HELO|nr:hypothetical protein HYALB_00004765 [Hymenoscyphus albidus]
MHNPVVERVDWLNRKSSLLTLTCDRCQQPATEIIDPPLGNKSFCKSISRASNPQKAFSYESGRLRRRRRRQQQQVQQQQFGNSHPKASLGLGLGPSLGNQTSRDFPAPTKLDSGTSTVSHGNTGHNLRRGVGLPIVTIGNVEWTRNHDG